MKSIGASSGLRAARTWRSSLANRGLVGMHGVTKLPCLMRDRCEPATGHRIWARPLPLISEYGSPPQARRTKRRGTRAPRGPPGHQDRCPAFKHNTALVVIAVDLLEEGLGVERVGTTGDAGDD